MTHAATTDTTPAPRVRARALAALAAGVVLVAGVVIWRIQGQDVTVPYDDPQAVGLLTLCSADGEAVTEGKVGDQPFAAFVLGDTGLPAEVEPTGAVATLYAYQPREGVAAGEFSGAPLTAAGALGDPARPGVRVTEDVWTVDDFVTAFPADLDGFVQLRLVLGTPEAGTLTENPYDTADLRVDGDRWELVRGGSASCSDASERVG